MATAKRKPTVNRSTPDVARRTPRRGLKERASAPRDVGARALPKDGTADVIRGFVALPDSDAFAQDCQDAATDMPAAIARALKNGEAAAVAHARMSAGEIRHDVTLLAAIKVLQSALDVTRREEHTSELLREVELIEAEGLAVEERHARHGDAARCTCDAELDVVGERHAQAVRRFSDVYNANELAMKVAGVLFPAPTPNTERRTVCAAVRASSLMLASSRKSGSGATAESLARGLLVNLCRSQPALGRRLVEHELELVAAIEASGSRGRPRSGAPARPTADVALEKLLKLLRLGVSNEALRSDRKRKKWGAVDAEE